MRVWILKASEPTPYDAVAGGHRLYRYGLLCKYAVQQGHEIRWWTDDYSHTRKAHRFGRDTVTNPTPGTTVHFIHTPGYRRNVSVARLRDHGILARRFARLAEQVPQPDVILAGMPTDHFCQAAVQYGSKRGIPVVLDVRDLWPDVFFSQVPRLLWPGVWAATRPMMRRVRWAFSRADGIIGNTEAFVRWGLARAGRDWGENDTVVPLAYQPPELTTEEAEEAHQFWTARGIGVDDGILTVAFLGTLGRLYEYGPIIRAARILSADARPVRFVICGQGPELPRLKREASEFGGAVVLPGWVNAAKAWHLLERSQVGLAPYRDLANFRQNIPNKPAEYLAASLPFLVGVSGEMATLVESCGCGSYYRSGEELALQLRQYRDNPTLLEEQREAARRKYEQTFDAQAVYGKLLEHLQHVAGGRLPTPERNIS